MIDTDTDDQFYSGTPNDIQEDSTCIFVGNLAPCIEPHHLKTYFKQASLTVVYVDMKLNYAFCYLSSTDPVGDDLNSIITSLKDAIIMEGKYHCIYAYLVS